ncbi:3,4-dihydroxy-2-butanone 4-phosphate synthase [Chryseobacterium jejuense]|nr:3,4-dihydroxy-2-butanone 4-phosphate synthase [Chryseobacterium jejuense]
MGRNGHTEGSIDLMRLAGLKPMSVLCELMNDDGTMSRFPQIVVFALKHDLMILSIEDIIQYRKTNTSYNLLKENVLQ